MLNQWFKMAERDTRKLWMYLFLCTMSCSILKTHKGVFASNPDNAGRNLVITVTSTTKEYWVPSVTTTIQVRDTETIQAVVDQLCFIFHRSHKMAEQKENYPCKQRSNNLLLYETARNRRIYSKRPDGSPVLLNYYNLKNGSEFLLYYS